ncbi:glycosyltransferase [Mariniflexile ostreae]|uniref:Glycosyltransferase n=1 Tax=Mariniflexile ostreae TaxID=1520892 RepID=A0ABV5F763_9FLAO
MEKKNILYITVRSDIGGGPIHVNELIQHLPLKNTNIFIACPFSGSIYIENWKLNTRIKKSIEVPFRKFSIKTLFILINFIKINNIDIIHSHGKGAGIYSRLLKFIFKKVKVVHTFHGIGNVQAKGAFNKVKNIYLETILKRFTTVFIAVSSGEKDIAVNFFKINENKIRVIYNGVKDTFAEPKVSSSKHVITFSRFSYEKNMMASYEIVKKTKSDILFNWVGDGEDFNKVRIKIDQDNRRNLVLSGFQKNTHQYLTPGSVYLSTSRYEGLPLALLEALANGIPIVATNVIGNNEVVIDNFNGFLVPEGDTQTAVKKIERLYNDSVLYKKMSENARAYFLNLFTVNQMINATIKLYDEIFV